MSKHINTLRAIIDAWARQDVEGLVKHLHEDVTWNNSGGFRKPLKGREAMRRALERMKDQIEESKWCLYGWAEVGDTVWMEGADEFIRKDGIRIAVPYAGVLEFEGDVVKHWREYFDGRLQEQQLAGEPVSEYVEAMLDRPKA
ncbi:nuclear transport factor 2 family protein [Hyphococcus sp. DH-69]|uniref:nuclear transport factor 2 family protein n=1 Tax=Hyphococcus formosus TaxID=3143534 RepID=UPI00398B2C84